MPSVNRPAPRRQPAAARALALAVAAAGAAMLAPAARACDLPPDDTWTLSAVLARAACVSPDLAVRDANVDAQRALREQRQGATRPTWSAEAGPSLARSRSTGSASDTLQASGRLVLDWTVADAGAGAARVAQAAQQLKSTEAARQAQALDVALQALGAYLDVRDADATRDAAGAAVADAQRSARAAVARETAGRGTGVEVLQARSALAQAEADAATAQADAERARLALCQQLDLPADRVLRLPEGEGLDAPDGLGGEPPADAAALDALWARATATDTSAHPDWLAQRATTQAAAAAVAAARADLRPTVAFSASLSPTALRVDAGGSLRNSHGIDAQAALTWRLVLDDAGQGRARVAQADAQWRAEQARETAVARSLRDTAWARWTDWRSARRQAEAADAALAAAQAAADATAARYEAGRGTLGDLLTAQSEAAARRRAAALARHDVDRQRYRLAAALGVLPLPASTGGADPSARPLP